jgi:intracellular sulfur oxidation DsrE/DsrF family protein|tara:strand:- start:34 stop:465 length:432 start_codon:yes stop_codon:yes gene_type:complete
MDKDIFKKQLQESLGDRCVDGSKKITQKEKRIEFFDRISEGLGFDVNEYVDDESLMDITSCDELYDILEDGGAFDIEIIYYHNAIKYLRDNDASLHESIQIASEMGFETKALNSELLASLLATHNARLNFEDLRNEINEFLNK